MSKKLTQYIKNKYYLERLVEEIFYPFGDAQNKSVGVAQHIQSQNQHVQLFNGLTHVVSGGLADQLVAGQEHVVPFEIRQP